MWELTKNKSFEKLKKEFAAYEKENGKNQIVEGFAFEYFTSNKTHLGGVKPALAASVSRPNLYVKKDF